jgi:hypothetical protein
VVSTPPLQSVAGKTRRFDAAKFGLEILQDFGDQGSGQVAGEAV